MSEHQYYEFEAVDRRLTLAQQMELRALSSRAEISATRFTNTYNYGSFRGDPDALMARFFDLHLHLANWGTRRFMVRLPRRTVDEAAVTVALDACEEAQVRVVADDLLLTVERHSDDGYPDSDVEDGDWLPALAPLREAALDGDLRLVYLAWLLEVSAGEEDAATREPFPGLGPIDGAVRTFADLFDLDVDLITAAAERPFRPPGPPRNPAAEIAGLPAAEKDAWLARLYAGEDRLDAALRTRLRPARAPDDERPGNARRTVGDLLARAAVCAADRRAAEARAAEEARRRAQAEEDRKLRARLVALKSRGEGAWREVETQIDLRSASGYDRAAALLADLHILAKRDGIAAAYDERLAAIRQRHAAKRTFIQRLERGRAARS